MVDTKFTETSKSATKIKMLMPTNTIKKLFAKNLAGTKKTGDEDNE